MYNGNKRSSYLKFIAVIPAILLYCQPLFSQKKDTTNGRANQIINEVMRPFKRDTAQVDRLHVLRRNDEKYQSFTGLKIRNIDIKRIPFGASFADTTQVLENTLTHLANKLHHLTRIQVIKKNLFFGVYDTINPYLLADNERYLRDLSYLRDADFKIIRVAGTDSADVVVVTKDLFSLGGAVNSLGLDVSNVEVREDNIRGSGNAAVLYLSYDENRTKNLALGGELIRRNIDQTFITQTVGYQSYYNSVRAPRQENYFYYNLNKPLLNRYTKFTYELDVSYHSTSNRYNTDSIYNSDFRYRYSQFEGWLGYNINGRKFSPADESKKLRLLSGVRVVSRNFNIIPEKYKKNYNWEYANLGAVLASFTFYRQNFFKTQFVYGFGINEDIPEGLLFTFTSGYTIKEDLSRPFIGVNFQQYGFIKNKNYLDYTLRFEGYLNKKRIEDINLLASINYFDQLKPINGKWKQRFFLSLSAARQINSVLNEPLFLNSSFGLAEYGKDYRGGDIRISSRAESVFFSPWSLAAFRFAPLLSVNVTAFAPADSRISLFSSIGAGIRTRNESLIFGTIELKGNYFPNKNFYGDYLTVDLSTNVAFKYRRNFLEKPNFIQIN